MSTDVNSLPDDLMYPLAIYGLRQRALGKSTQALTTACDISLEDEGYLFGDSHGEPWASAIVANLLSHLEQVVGEGSDEYLSELQTFVDVTEAIVSYWDRAAMAWALSKAVTPLHLYVGDLQVQGAEPFIVSPHDALLGNFKEYFEDYESAVAWILSLVGTPLGSDDTQTGPGWYQGTC